jgi:type III restriction enzyme
MQERLAFDIVIPLTKPVLIHNVKKLSTLDPLTFEPIYDQPELAEPVRVTLKMEFITTETEVHQEDFLAGSLPIAQELLSSLTNRVIQRAKLANVFAELYPIVRRYVAERCFGKVVEVDDETIRSYLRQAEIQDGIAKYLSRKISELTLERRTLEFENATFKLSDTKPFTWRRNLPPLEAKRTLFNYVATYNDFERRFAEFLDQAPDVLRFASLGTTEQGDSGMQFRVDYLKPSGAIGFYHPDWVVVQKTADGDVHWIIETKGRVWEGTEAKDAAIRDWCQRITGQTGRQWEFVRVNQSAFQASKPRTLAEIVKPVSKRSWL